MTDTAGSEERPLNDEADVLDVLRALVRQIAGTEYCDHFGHRLELHAAYLEAVALLEMRGVLEP
ncbi:hypothetical protein LJR225_002510 [Phenylobacterium sp. LjRoot225]|uniref:hypothetical protein n=1 Tax=Phenylobacterium sp. LjRoot225 TaxID=3342285 RepID=UPI003ECC8DAF